ncbi:glycosyltransferase [Klebsiella sp. R390]|uniref:glycosyltransferase n=1 Tax=Klebsiella sp. R390 TaxID=2755400 RepID=UPI003DA9E5EC
MLAWIVGPSGRFDTGVAKYSFELVSALKKLCHLEIELVYLDDKGKPNSLRRYMWQFIYLPVWFMFKKNKEDVVIYQEAFSHISFFRIFSKKKTIVIIHHVPEVNDNSVKGVYLKILFFILKKMKNVIYATPTLFTKDLLSKCMSIPQERIYVVPNAVSYDVDINLTDATDIKVINDLLEKKKQGYKIALNIGSFEKRKNISVLGEALRLLQDEKVYFVKAGFAIDEKIKQEFDMSMKEYDIDYLLLEKISSNLIGKLYQCCDLYLAPATYEGFGRTLVEAQNAECLVLSSSIPAHNEIMASTSLVVTNYMQPDEWAKAIKLALSKNKIDYDKIIEQGKKNASRFSPFNVAKTFMKIL